LTEILPYDMDKDLVEAVRADGKPRIRLRRYTGLSVVCGRGSRPEVELRLDAIQEDRVPVLRRPGGGCAVVLDPGNVIVSVVLNLPGVAGIKSAFAGISDWIIEGLSRSGVSRVTRKGISDLALGERKIGGSCIYRSRDLLYYSTTLLVEPDLELVERYLEHPPREPEYRGGRTHREFMGSLSGLIGRGGIDAFVGRLADALKNDLSGLLQAAQLRVA